MLPVLLFAPFDTEHFLRFLRSDSFWGQEGFFERPGETVEGLFPNPQRGVCRRSEVEILCPAPFLLTLAVWFASLPACWGCRHSGSPPVVGGLRAPFPASAAPPGLSTGGARSAEFSPRAASEGWIGSR